MQEIIDLVNQYGVPTVVAVGMSYFIYYIWKFVTIRILPTLSQAKTTLIALIDRVRMLDNDMIRLDQKINTILELQKQEKEKDKNEKSK
jgi:sensor histidine kinase YesM